VPTANQLDIKTIRAKLTQEASIIPKFKVESLSDYCDLTDIIRQLWSKKARDRFPGPGGKGYVGEILPWFRGARNAKHTLTPSLARDWRKYYELYDHIYDLEEYYYDRFTRFGRPFLGGTMPNDEIEWNYIMRHHSIPSRLLDWTKGSLIALSYATQAFSEDLDSLAEFMSARSDGSPTSSAQTSEDCTCADDRDAVVWMMEPRRLMETATKCLYPQPIRNIASRRKKVRAMRRDFFKDRAQMEATSSDEELSNPDLWDNEGYWRYPLPLIPSHISARVGSHLSRFTLHSLSSYVGTSSTPPDSDIGLACFARDAFNEKDDGFWYLVKIELPADRLHTIARVLRMTGVADMNLTQDLDGLSRELKLRAALGFLDDKKDGGSAGNGN
jgi:hypothetical protein